MLRLKRFFKEYKKEFILGPFFKLLEAIFELIVPLVMASIIDVGIQNGDKVFVYKRIALILLLGVLGLCFALICQYYGSVASQGCGTNIRNALFRHISGFSYAQIDQFGSNSFITRITNDVNQVQLAIAMFIRLAVRAPFLVIGSAVMAILLDVKLSLVFLFVIPLVSFVLYFIFSKSVPYYRIRQSKLDHVSLIARENLEGVRVIRAFRGQDTEWKRFQRAGDEMTDVSIKVGHLSAILNPATFLILYFAILFIVWYGGVRVNAGHLTKGQVIAFVGYITQISLTLVVAANLVIIFTKAFASAIRINEVFDTATSVKDGAVSEITGQGAGQPIISFDHVTFAYGESDQPALEDVTIDIHPGETIGVIGGTGSGKTTFINLIPRFYDVSSGSIRVAGRNVKEYSLQTLRSLFGIVPQNAVLFEGTIEENLRWGKPDATSDEMNLAVKMAQAEEIVKSRPKGYASYVSQGGKNLSGGQRQRLTIARALIGSPRILILDDSSSALDYATEAGLRQSLREIPSHTTTLIVSQRTSSIQHADKIMVLDDGRVMGVGTHEELLNACQVYREIHSIQTNAGGA